MKRSILTAEAVELAKRLLAETNMSQNDVAKLIGVKRSTLYFAVSGNAKTPYPSVTDREGLADFIRRTADNLVKLTDETTPMKFQ